MNIKIEELEQLMKEISTDWKKVKPGSKVIVVNKYQKYILYRYFHSYNEDNEYFPFKVALTKNDDFTGAKAIIDDTNYSICFLLEK